MKLQKVIQRDLKKMAKAVRNLTPDSIEVKDRSTMRASLKFEFCDRSDHLNTVVLILDMVTVTVDMYWTGPMSNFEREYDLRVIDTKQIFREITQAQGY